MPQSWLRTLQMYCYLVDLSVYKEAPNFPGFFELYIEGNRQSTIDFEDRFRELAHNNTPAYLEVVFWKLFFQANISQKTTQRIAQHIARNGIMAHQLCQSIEKFIGHPTTGNLTAIRNLLGIKNPVLATALTLVSFADPANFPMIDRHVAQWINNNRHAHNANNHLTQFVMDYNVLRDNDFSNYLNWVFWCREIAQVLTNAQMSGNITWRARDVEMAVFTAQRNGLVLNPLFEHFP